MRFVFIIVVGLLFASLLSFCSTPSTQNVQVRTKVTPPPPCHISGSSPDPHCTPGDAFSQATVAQICTPGYASSVRDVPKSEKAKVYSEYGVGSHKPGDFEVDHLISLELGGSNDIKNLWPESYSGPENAHVKDTLENNLHAQVCSGVISLACAQHAIATNWVTAYDEMKRQAPLQC